MSCDEAVIRKLGNQIKKDYSTSLLNFAAGRKGSTGAPLAFGEGATGSRIKNVLRYKKPAFWGIIGAVAVCVIAAVALISNPESAQRDNAGDGNSGVALFKNQEGDIAYDDELFHERADEVDVYLKNSHLVLSSQEGIIRTDKVSEAERYCYETLNLITK